MKIELFSYKVEHDLGLAPNPFGQYCTLAVCKPRIRRNINLKMGDWIIGTGSVKLKNVGHLIYAMKVEEFLSFQEYWEDGRFQYKKPQINGSLVKMFGDNFYHYDDIKEEWVQENSAHSKDYGEPNLDHLKNDTDGKRVIISTHYYYFGDVAPIIPFEYEEVCSKSRGEIYKKIPENVKLEFILWLESSYQTGIHGDPISWSKYIDKQWDEGF